MDVQLHALVISVLAGGKWSVSRSGRITPGNRNAGKTHWTEAGRSVRWKET
jgi:hypothetical protein